MHTQPGWISNLVGLLCRVQPLLQAISMSLDGNYIDRSKAVPEDPGEDDEDDEEDDDVVVVKKRN